MAALYPVSANDTANDLANKINENNQSLNAAINTGGGGGGSTSSGIIARNEDAVNRIYAAKKHFDTVAGNNSTEQWETGNTENCFCIAHGSDFHCDVDRYENFKDFVDGVTAINAVVNTGDLLIDATSAEINDPNGILSVEFARLQPMVVIGNHDVYGGLTKAQVCELFGMSNNYYSQDFASYGIKVIVLDEYDMANLTKANAGKSGWFQEGQITWFINQLKSAKTNGMSVIVCRHSYESKAADNGVAGRYPTQQNGIFTQRNNKWERKLRFANSDTIIEDIVAAFRSGVNITKTYTFDNANPITVETDFSGEGDFICYIAGHTHIDMTGYSYYHPDQLYMMCPTSAVSGKDGSNQTHIYGTVVSDLPRVDGTKTEDCFNVYAIDTINKLVKVVRVGADTNDLMEKREMAYYNYQPSNS